MMEYTVKIDGMTFEQVKWNVYVFGADVKKFRYKVDRARKPHTQVKWQKKLDFVLKCLEDNKRRLALFPIEQAWDDYLRTEVEPNA